MSTSPACPWWVVLTLAVAACGGDRYTIVELNSGTDLVTVTSLHVVTAVQGTERRTDFASADQQPLGWPLTFSVQIPPAITSVQLAVFARDDSAATLAIGDADIGSELRVAVVLAPPAVACGAGQICCSRAYCDNGQPCGNPTQPCCDGYLCAGSTTACLRKTCQSFGDGGMP